MSWPEKKPAISRRWPYGKYTVLMTHLAVVTDIIERANENYAKVTVLYRPAYFSVALDNELLMSTLKKSLRERVEIQMEWDPFTMEIIRAECAQT
jgi:hypothetical protein